jgi:hypothetical protein
VHIIEDFEHWREQHSHHRIPTIPANQETPMTTPQQPARLVDSLHAITGELASNPLIARLAEHRLGSLLTLQEADHFAALIASVEQPRRAQQADSGTQQQATQAG